MGHVEFLGRESEFCIPSIRLTQRPLFCAWHSDTGYPFPTQLHHLYFVVDLSIGFKPEDLWPLGRQQSVAITAMGEGSVTSGYTPADFNLFVLENTFTEPKWESLFVKVTQKPLRLKLFCRLFDFLTTIIALKLAPKFLGVGPRNRAMWTYMVSFLQVLPFDSSVFSSQ